MRNNLDRILSIFTKYVEHPSQRDIPQWLVKSQVDTNDADYIYGMAIHSNREIVAICIQIAWEASQSTSKDYQGRSEYLLERYHDNHEYYIRGLDEFIGTLEFKEIPEEARAWIREVLGSGYGSTAYNIDFEDFPEDLWDDDGHITDEGLKKYGYMFFDQLIRELTQDVNTYNSSINSHQSMLDAGVNYKKEPLTEEDIKRTKDWIKGQEKSLKKCKEQIAMLESFYTKFPKPEEKYD